MEIFLNQRRLRDYPRLFFFTTWILLLVNWVFHRGWLGAVGQIIGNDFLVFYSAGLLFRTDPQSLYDPIKLNNIQNMLIQPTQLEGLIPYTNPPFVAPVFSLLTYLPYGLAFIVWTLLSIGCLWIATHKLSKILVPKDLTQLGLSGSQLFFITGGYFGFIEGLQVGQNHAITLLLVSFIITGMLQKRPGIAGVAAGLLLYKPHFILGFLILWLVWKEWKAIFAFGVTAMVWLSISLYLQGIDPYLTYIGLIPKLMQLYNLKGLGSFLEVTLYGLLVSFFGPSNWSWLSIINQVLAISTGIGILVFGWNNRNQSTLQEKAPAIIMAVLYPIIFSPHVLLHDSILLMIVFLLWSWIERTVSLLYIAILAYLSALILPWFTYRLGINLLGIIPIFLVVRLIIQQSKTTKIAQLLNKKGR